MTWREAFAPVLPVLAAGALVFSLSCENEPAAAQPPITPCALGARRAVGMHFPMRGYETTRAPVLEVCVQTDDGPEWVVASVSVAP